MPLRFVITKSTAQGEQFTAEIAQCDPVTGECKHDNAEVMSLVDDVLQQVDMRMTDMNIRMLEAYELEKHFEPAMWQKIVAILDILAGRQSAYQVEQRWAAAIEETKDLERLRQEAYENAQAGE